MSIWLSDEFALDGFQHGLAVSGRQIVQEADFLRSAKAAFYARGNRSMQLSFSVLRAFTTVAAAELFLLGHYTVLEDGPGTLTCRCGGGSEPQTDVLIPGAVLESVSHPRYIGSSVLVTYTFRFAPVSVITPPADDLELMTRSGTLNIPAGVSTKTFTGLAFPSMPSRIIGAVSTPAGGDQIHGDVDYTSISTDGFTLNLSGETPDGDYRYDYIAFL